MLAPLGLICLASVVGLLPLSYTILVTSRAAVLMLAAVSVTVWVTALLRCLASLASRIPDERLARRTNRMGHVLRWVLPVFLGAMILSFTRLFMIVPVGTGVSAPAVQAIFGLTGLLFGCVVLFLLARLASIMHQYRRAFRSLPLQGGD